MVDYLSIYIEDGLITTHTGTLVSIHNFDSDGKAPVQVHNSDAHSGTIGTESQITFTTSGHAHTGVDSKAVAWSSISGRPTLVSSFTNDSGYKTGYCTYCTYCTYCNYCSYCTYCQCVCDCK